MSGRGCYGWSKRERDAVRMGHFVVSHGNTKTYLDLHIGAADCPIAQGKMMIAYNAAPESLLNAFLSRMAEWENAYWIAQVSLIEQGQATATCDQEYRRKLCEILEDRCVEDPKAWGRLQAMGCFNPSMYDPIRDPVCVVGNAGKSWTATVEQTVGLRATFRFTLIEVSGRWRIKKKDTLRDGKWCKATL